ncbi:MAG TPA: mechanosensitive ion channel family protein [Polyangiaceae bacterium]|nr:mechanosensitive ion channel family protein [Polyangiaceae bacterium]
MSTKETSPHRFSACLRWWVLCIAVSYAFLGAPTMAMAQGKAPTCNNPRDAADAVFKWQLVKEPRMDWAAACLEREGRSQAQLEGLAKKIRTVYDAHGAFVVMDEIPSDPEYVDDKLNPIVVPHEALPDVVVAKKGERWVWTKESLDHVERYYEEVGAVVKIADRLPAFFHDVKVLRVALWQYLALVLLVALGLVVRKIIAAVVASRIKALTEKLQQEWPSKIVEVIASPVALALTAIVLRIGYPQLLLPVDWSKALAALVRVLITISILWALYRSVDLLTARLAEKAETTESKLDDQLIPLLRKTLKVLVVVVGTLVVLQNLDFDVTTLFASVSIGGLALGLAAKDALANLFGSISIFVDNPFQIGDWINVAGKDGTVEEVGFRSTRIRTFYDSVLVMPNATVANANIDNYGLRQFRRCFVTLGLTYDTTPEQMQAFVEGVRAIIKANPLTRKDAYEVHMSGFGDSALEVMVYFFFECETWTEELEARHNIFLEFMRLARDLGVGFAFPTQSLHIESSAKPTDKSLPPPLPSDDLKAIVAAYGPKGERSRPRGIKITKSQYVPDEKADRGSTDEDG